MLWNLLLVCSRHHILIHQHGFQLTLQDDRTLQVRTADGTVPTDWNGEKIDLGYVVNVLVAHAA